LPRAIGYLAGSDIMESASQSMMSESRSTKRDFDSINKEIKNNEKALKDFIDLDKKFSTLAQIQKDILNIKQFEENIVLLNVYLKKINAVKEDIRKINTNINTLEDRIELNTEVALIKAKISDYKKIKEYSQKYSSTKFNIDNIKSTLSKASLFFESYKPSELKKLKLHLSNYSQIEIIKNSSSKLLDNISNIKSSMQDIDDQNVMLEIKIAEMKKQLLEANYICKECGQKLK